MWLKEDIGGRCDDASPGEKSSCFHHCFAYHHVNQLCPWLGPALTRAPAIQKGIRPLSHFDLPGGNRLPTTANLWGVLLLEKKMQAWLGWAIYVAHCVSKEEVHQAPEYSQKSEHWILIGAWVAHSWPGDRSVPCTSPFMYSETPVLWTFTVQSEVICYQQQLRGLHHIRGTKQTWFLKPSPQWFTSISFTDPWTLQSWWGMPWAQQQIPFYLIILLSSSVLLDPILKSTVVAHPLLGVCCSVQVCRGESLLLSGRILFDKGWRQLPMRNHQDTCYLSN